MKDKISALLKKYVNIFLKEYSSYLNKEQLILLKQINYNQIIKFANFSIPVGIINYSSIYLSDNLLNIPKTNNKYIINNKNYTSYLKILNNNGCNTYEYYAHQLMFLVFKLVINQETGLINGFINYEINNLKRKYKFQAVNLYQREELIANKVRNVLGRDNVLKIMFMDMPSSFKYLNNILGYRYADYYYRVSLLMDNEYKKIRIDNYTSKDGLVKYARDYDSLLYGSVYNYLLDFSINNS